MRREPAISPQPGEGALDHPSPADDFEAASVVGALDDLESNRLRCEIGFELAADEGAVGEDAGNEREAPAGPADQLDRAIAILHARRDHRDAEQQTYGIDQGVTLDALCLLGRVVARRIGMGPPFSAALTVCVSMMAAVGEASRPSASRQATSSVLWMRSSMP